MKVVLVLASMVLLACGRSQQTSDLSVARSPDAAAPTIDAQPSSATTDAASAYDASASTSDASFEQQCEAHASCADCETVPGCYWCADRAGRCVSQYANDYWTCTELQDCTPSTTPDAGPSPPPPPSCTHVCGNDADCASGEFCSFIVRDQHGNGCCEPNNNCPEHSCLTTSDCWDPQYTCNQGCCWYCGTSCPAP
jgi:hypothetical protein